MYKYLGCSIDEHLDFDHTVDILADSAGRALSSIITKMKGMEGFPTMFSVHFIKLVCAPLLTMEGKFLGLGNTVQHKRYTLGLPDHF